MAVTAKRRRPSEIVVVAGILVLNGVVDTASGALILGLGAGSSDPSASVEGAAVAIFGLFALVVSGELWAGKAWAREAGLAIAVLGFVGNAFQFEISSIDFLQIAYVLAGTLLNVGIIVGLMSSEAKAYLGIGAKAVAGREQTAGIPSRSESDL